MSKTTTTTLRLSDPVRWAKVYKIALLAQVTANASRTQKIWLIETMK